MRGLFTIFRPPESPIISRQKSFRKYSQDELASIIVIGPSGAGKTSLIRKLVSKSLHEVTSTLGVDIEHWKQNVIFDLGGRKAIQEVLWPSYIQLADGLIFVVDGTDSEQSEEAFKTLRDLISSLNPNIPILILLNKSDSPKFTLQKELICLCDTEEMIRRQNYSLNIAETSAYENKNIISSFEWLIECIRKEAMAKPLQLQAARVCFPEPLITLVEVGNTPLFEHILELLAINIGFARINLRYMPLGGGNYLVACSSTHYYCMAIFHENTAPSKGLAFAESLLQSIEQKIYESGQPFPQMLDVDYEFLTELANIPFTAP